MSYNFILANSKERVNCFSLQILDTVSTWS